MTLGQGVACTALLHAIRAGATSTSSAMAASSSREPSARTLRHRDSCALATRPSWASLVKREQMPALVETLDGVLAVVAEPLAASEHEIAYGG